METKDEKAARYVREGRLRVDRVDPERGLIVATMRGADAEYALGYDPVKKEWRCTCPARTPRCAHLIALQLVTVKPPS